MDVLSRRVLVRPGDLDRSRRFYREVLGLAVYQGFGPSDDQHFLPPEDNLRLRDRIAVRGRDVPIPAPCAHCWPATSQTPVELRSARAPLTGTPRTALPASESARVA